MFFDSGITMNSETPPDLTFVAFILFLFAKFRIAICHGMG